MADNEINVIAEIRPKQGKTQRVLELIKEAAQYVEQEEKGTQRYEMYASARPNKDGTETIFMVERYKHKQALKEHGESGPFQKFQQALAKEQLLLAAPAIHIVSPKGGFSSRL